MKTKITLVAIATAAMAVAYIYHRDHGLLIHEALLWGVVSSCAWYATGAAIGLYVAGVADAVHMYGQGLITARERNPELRLPPLAWVFLVVNCLVFPIWTGKPPSKTDGQG